MPVWCAALSASALKTAGSEVSACKVAGLLCHCGLDTAHLSSASGSTLQSMAVLHRHAAPGSLRVTVTDLLSQLVTVSGCASALTLLSPGPRSAVHLSSLGKLCLKCLPHCEPLT